MVATSDGAIMSRGTWAAKGGLPSGYSSGGDAQLPLSWPGKAAVFAKAHESVERFGERHPELTGWTGGDKEKTRLANLRGGIARTTSALSIVVSWTAC